MIDKSVFESQINKQQNGLIAISKSRKRQNWKKKILLRKKIKDISNKLLKMIMRKVKKKKVVYKLTYFDKLLQIIY